MEISCVNLYFQLFNQMPLQWLLRRIGSLSTLKMSLHPSRWHLYNQLPLQWLSRRTANLSILRILLHLWALTQNRPLTLKLWWHLKKASKSKVINRMMFVTHFGIFHWLRFNDTTNSTRLLVKQNGKLILQKGYKREKLRKVLLVLVGLFFNQISCRIHTENTIQWQMKLEWTSLVHEIPIDSP